MTLQRKRIIEEIYSHLRNPMKGVLAIVKSNLSYTKYKHLISALCKETDPQTGERRFTTLSDGLTLPSPIPSYESVRAYISEICQAKGFFFFFLMFW